MNRPNHIPTGSVVPRKRRVSAAVDDPALSSLHTALDTDAVRERIAPVISRAEGWENEGKLIDVRLIRHKRGRRAVVYYEFEIGGRRVGYYAKIRARGADMRTHALLRLLEHEGFDQSGDNLTAVPAAVAALPDLDMTIQRACAGEPFSRLLDAPRSVDTVRHVARAIFDLHRADVETHRDHPIDEELAILDSRLSQAADLVPTWRNRIERIAVGCRALARRLDSPRVCGIHRDFYPDQVVVDGSKVTILDLDLFAAGDPALDVGNFSGHLTEVSLRIHGTPSRYSTLENAFEERYLELAPHVSPDSIRTYKLLTLARHVHLSMTLDGRSGVTRELIDYCAAQIDVADSKSN